MPKRFPAVILGTCLVPWDETYTFQEELFRRQVRLLRATLTDHLYVFGTAGEGYAVSDRQFERIATVFAEEMRHGGQPILGIISLSLATIIERIELGLTLGYDTFQLSLPSWGELTDAELDRFFVETCGRFPQARFLHYNLPRVKRLLTGKDYARLAAAHPNLVAVKSVAPDREFQVEQLTQAPALQFFYVEQPYARVRDQFECGFLISIATCHPGRAKRFFAARGQELASLAAELKLDHDALKAAFAGASKIDGAYDKLFSRVVLPEFPLHLLPPYQGASEAVFAAFNAARTRPELAP